MDIGLYFKVFVFAELMIYKYKKENTIIPPTSEEIISPYLACIKVGMNETNSYSRCRF